MTSLVYNMLLLPILSFHLALNLFPLPISMFIQNILYLQAFLQVPRLNPSLLLINLLFLHLYLQAFLPVSVYLIILPILQMAYICTIFQENFPLSFLRNNLIILSVRRPWISWLRYVHLIGGFIGYYFVIIYYVFHLVLSLS